EECALAAQDVDDQASAWAQRGCAFACLAIAPKKECAILAEHEGKRGRTNGRRLSRAAARVRIALLYARPREEHTPLQTKRIELRRIVAVDSCREEIVFKCRSARFKTR